MNQDTVSLLQPTVVVLRACGVCPSALRGLDIPTSNKIYGLFLGITFIGLCISEVNNMYNSYDGIVCFMVVLMVVVLIVQHVVLILSAFLTCNSLIKFFRIMDSVQRSLFSLNIKQQPSPSKISQMVWLVMIFILPILSFFARILEGKIFLAIFGISKILVTSGTVSKIRVLLALIDEKFDLLNWHFDDLNNRWPVFLPRPSDVSFRELSSVREWRKTKFINEDEDTRTVTAEKVRNFNKAHLKLVYASRTLNSVFSFAVFVHIVTSVITLAVTLSMTLAWPNFYKYIGLITVGSSKIMELVVILSLSSRVQEKAGRMALLVHDLLDEDHHSPDAVQQLEEFSMALLHRKTVFSAAGFFDFDLKLVSRITGILAPIVLFLVQQFKNQLPT